MTARNAPITVAQIIPQLDTGGAEVTTVEIVEALRKAGARAVVLTTGGRLASAVEAVGGEVVRFPAASKNPITIIWNGVRLARYIKQTDIQLIHARSRAPAWSARIAARLSGARFVTTYHGVYKETNGFKKFYNSIMSKADTVIANSNYTARMIAQRYGIGGDKLAIILRGVDHGGKFRPDAINPHVAAGLRASWGIAPDCPIVLLPARISPIKGHATAVDAAALLQSRGKLGRLMFVFVGGAQGRDAYVSNLESKIRDSGLTSHFHFAGHCDDMATAFSLAYVTLATSVVPEGFGRVSAEAQAMGCPVIVTSIGALPETVITEPDDLATGWLVPPGDAAALAHAIEHAVNMTPSQRAAMGVRARHNCVARFSMTTLQSQTLGVYDRLLGSNLADRFAETIGTEPAPPPTDVVVHNS